jgi:hypothetical protein
MKKIILITFFSFFISSISYSQSSLPKCIGNDRSNFHNCFGEYMFYKSKYIGEFQKELPNGQGTMYYTDGSKYVGEWKNGLINGQGTYDFKNGDRYVGEWKNGNMDGNGTLMYKNGGENSGSFTNNKPSSSNRVKLRIPKRE